MLDSPQKPQASDFAPWTDAPNALGFPWSVPRASAEAATVEIVSSFGIAVATTPYSTREERKAIEVCSNFIADAMNHCARAFGTPQSGGDLKGRTINYKDALRILDVFAAVPLLKAGVGLNDRKSWMTGELKTALFSPTVEAMRATRHVALKEFVGLRSSSLFHAEGKLDGMMKVGASNLPLVMMTPIVNADALKRDFRTQRNAENEMAALERQPFFDEEIYADRMAAAQGAASGVNEQWRKAAPALVAHNVASKLMVEVTNACWQALDRGFGQPEHFPVFLQALRDGRSDLLALAPKLSAFHGEQGNPAQGLAIDRVMKNVNSALSCFADETDWNQVLLDATPAERVKWYKGWEKAAKERRAVEALQLKLF